MKTSGKIAIIGDKDVVLAFKALGVSIFPFTNLSKVKDVIKDLVKEEYSIILLSEKLALPLSDFLEKLKLEPYPIIVPIPDGGQSNNFGLNNLSLNVEKAIGANVVLNKEDKNG